jgi:hypothetical protein
LTPATVFLQLSLCWQIVNCYLQSNSAVKRQLLLFYDFLCNFINFLWARPLRYAEWLNRALVCCFVVEWVFFLCKAICVLLSDFDLRDSAINIISAPLILSLMRLRSLFFNIVITFTEYFIYWEYHLDEGIALFARNFYMFDMTVFSLFSYRNFWSWHSTKLRLVVRTEFVI